MPSNKFHESPEDKPQEYGYIDNDDADELLGYSYNWDEEDYSHRRNPGFCGKCGGTCIYDDDGYLIEDFESDD